MANLELYRVFYTVAKCGSLTKAADELYISQPAVSQAIKQLESQLGLPLFRRTHRGMELTPEGGKIIFSKVERALGFIDDAEKNLAQVNVTATGVVRIELSANLCDPFLAETIAEFHQKYPSVKVEFVYDKDEADFILTDESAESGEVVYAFSIEEIFVAAASFEELSGDSVSLGKLQGYPFIGYYPTAQSERAQNVFFKANGIKLNETVKVPSAEIAKGLALRGGGLTLLPRGMVQDELARGALIEIKTEATPILREGKLLIKKGLTSAAVRAFAETLKKEQA